MGRDSEVLALFPLSNVVLFPQVRCPLHLFEPRYRQLARHVLEGDRRIGMVTVRPEGLETIQGDPPVFDIGCAGVIADSEELADGRYNIVLQGSFRFRILGELHRPQGQLYRSARVERLEDGFDPADADRVANLRGRVIELVGSLAQAARSPRAAEFSSKTFDTLEDTALVNALSNALAFPPTEKQGLLEAVSILERYERLANLLSFRIAERMAPGTPESGSIH